MNTVLTKPDGARASRSIEAAEIIPNNNPSNFIVICEVLIVN